MNDAARIRGGPTGSWSSPATPTTPISGPPGPPRAGSTQGSDGLARVLHERRRRRRGSRTPIRSSWPPLREREQRAAADGRRLRGRDVPPPCPTARSPTTWPCASSSSARSGRSGPTRSSPPTRPSSSTATAGSTTPTIGRRASPPSTRSIRRPATRWRSRRWPAAGLAAHKVRRLYLFWPNEPNVRVDITATLDRKIAALRGARQPDQGARRLAERIRVVGRRGGRADRRRGGRGAPAVVIDEDEDEGPDRRAGRERSTGRPSAATARSSGRAQALEQDRPDGAPVVPELGQRRRRAARAA